MARDDQSTKGERTIAVGTLVVVPIMWALSFNMSVPGLWHLALFIYGAYGLLEAVVTLAEKRGTWGRRLELARIVAIGYAVLTLVVIVIQDGS